MTERLFENDPYLCEFEACVTECVPKNGIWQICMDRSAFFPEGGGQPGDRGYIGEAAVFDTHEREGDIWHYTHEPIEAGTRVRCRLDWKFRFSNMQNHAAEHIVSGLIHKTYGYDNVGFHMGSDAITLDMNGVLDEEQLQSIEKEANQAISKNLPITTWIPAREDLETLDYRSKKVIEGDVRIVEIPGYDRCACCGTHPFRTGEIRLIKLLSIQNYKGGVRISMLAGERAIDDYCQKHTSVVKISRLLSAKTGEVCEAVDHLLAENANLKFMLVQQKREIMRFKAEQQAIEGEAMCVLASEFKGNELREYANLLAQKAQCVLVLSEQHEGTYGYVLMDHAGQAKRFGKALNEHFSGKGGGSDQMLQGTLSGRFEDIRQWFLQA